MLLKLEFECLMFSSRIREIRGTIVLSTPRRSTSDRSLSGPLASDARISDDPALLDYELSYDSLMPTLNTRAADAAFTYALRASEQSPLVPLGIRTKTHFLS